MNDSRQDAALPDPTAARTAPGRRPACSPEEAFSCLLGVTQELNATADLESGLERVAARLRRHVPFETFAVLLLDDYGRELRFAYGYGFSPHVVDHWRFGLGQGLVGIAAETRRTVRVDDVLQDPRYIHASEAVRSELAIPLVAKDRIVGVLDIGAAEPGFFADEDRRLLEFLADHLAAAIENARLYQNMRDQARTLSLLHELSRELTSILDRERLLERVAELVKRLIDYDLFTVLLWNEATRTLEPSLALFEDGPSQGFAQAVPLGHGISGTAAALRQPVRVPNVHLDPRYVDCAPGLEVLSELAVPLVFKDRLIGVLDLESRRFDAFSSHHQQLLSTLGSSLAIALENARLYEQLRRDEEKLEADLSTAREVQKQLLPKATPWIPGLQVAVAYEPARHLGGDFYEFLPFAEGSAGIAVGDVAGKATSAALYGTLAIGMLREYADRADRRPAKILADMNQKLVRVGIDNRFLAMAAAVYDPSSRRLTLANSGLPYPYLLRRRGLRQIELGGVPLGMFPDQTYDEAVLELEEGDAVIFVSDGVEDTVNSEAAEFGGERVRGTLQRLAGGSARDLAGGLVDATRRFAGSAEATDDRTVVVLKVTGD